MHQLQRSWVRSQHLSAQWNLRGSRWSSAEYSTKKYPSLETVHLYLNFNHLSPENTFHSLYIYTCTSIIVTVYVRICPDIYLIFLISFTKERGRRRRRRGKLGKITFWSSPDNGNKRKAFTKNNSTTLMGNINRATHKILPLTLQNCFCFV